MKILNIELISIDDINMEVSGSSASFTGYAQNGKTGVRYGIIISYCIDIKKQLKNCRT